MLIDIADLRSFSLRATDGELGSIDDIYFSVELATLMCSRRGP